MTENTPLGRALTTIRELRGELDQMRHPRPVAIVGVGLRFPQGATSLDAFSAQLRAGISRSMPFPDSRRRHDRAEWEDLGNAPGSYLDDIWSFDCGYFGIGEDEARAVDPRTRLMLELTIEALDDAGLDLESVAGPRTGLFLVTTGTEHLRWATAATPEWAHGSGDCFALGRLSFHLGIEGPATCVDTACSSAIVALDGARRALQRGECDLALVGGAQLVLDPGDYRIGHVAGLLSAQGRCRSFDDHADGFIRGEGAGILLLCREEDALRYGVGVQGLIHASGVCQTGRATGFAIPNVLAESEGIRTVCSESGVNLDQIGLVEAHGTASKIGDAVEIEALARAFAERDVAEPLLVTCSKPVLGHTESLAGLSGVLAALAALRSGEAAPVAGLHERNTMVEWDTLPLELLRTTRPLPAQKPLVLVSALGMGGANGYVVLGPAPTTIGVIHSRTVPRRSWHHVDCSPELVKEPAELGPQPKPTAQLTISEPASLPDRLVAIGWQMAETARGYLLSEIRVVPGPEPLTAEVVGCLLAVGGRTVIRSPEELALRVDDALVLDLSGTVAGSGMVATENLRTVLAAGVHPGVDVVSQEQIARWWEIALHGEGVVLDIAGSTTPEEAILEWLRQPEAVSGCVRADRLHVLTGTALPAAPRPVDSGRGWRVTAAIPGRLESVAPVAAEPVACGAGEVRIRVNAAGLNFSDVLKALGRYPGQAGDPMLGVECSGTVEAVGEDVNDLRLGERVMAIAPGTFAQTVLTPRHLVAPVPDGMDMELAAGVPVAFLTAALAVLVEGRPLPGQTLLVHSAAGGVGQAVIQIARAAGTRVLATASTPQKRALLQELGAAEVADSRSDDFVSMVQSASHGLGVDVLVNSLSGQLFAASIGLMAAGGRFVELGKHEIYGQGELPLSFFREGRSFAAVDLDALVWRQPDAVRALWDTVARGFVTGAYHPIQTTRVNISELPSVMEQMAEGRHVGKIVVAGLHDTLFTPPPTAATSKRPGTAYISGWPAAAAQESAAGLLRGGWKTFTLRGNDDPRQLAAAAYPLRLAGASITEEPVATAERVVVLAPVAAANADTWESLAATIRLSRCTRATIVVEDSSVLPPALAWARTLTDERRHVDVCQRCAPHVMPELESVPAAVARLSPEFASSLGVMSVTQHVGTPSTPTSTQVLAAMPGASRVRLMSQATVGVAASVLGVEAMTVDPHAPLTELGFTSLRSLQFRQRLEDELGLVLPATLGWQYPTLERIASHLVDLLEQQALGGPTRIAAMPAPEERTIGGPASTAAGVSDDVPVVDAESLNRKIDQLEKELSR